MSVDPGLAAGLLGVAAALHLGFQLTVTLVVYPALERAARGDWDEIHGAHSRAIVPIVILVYAAVLLACGLAAVVLPLSVGLLIAVVGSGVAMVTTALFAARIHGDLTSNPDPALLQRLRQVDLVRTVAAAVSVGGAVAVLVTLGG